MRAPLSTRLRENARKKQRREQNRSRLQLYKQQLYFRQHGVWIADPRILHWHHVDPDAKYRKISQLVTRSWGRILLELRKCTVLHEREHRALHGGMR